MKTFLMIALFALSPGVAMAQSATDGCEGETVEPATPPSQGASSGTAPGNAGSTGWTGGTGGSHTGTAPAGAVPQSPTWQPPTASGLDLKGTPDERVGVADPQGTALGQRKC